MVIDFFDAWLRHHTLRILNEYLDTMRAQAIADGLDPEEVVRAFAEQMLADDSKNRAPRTH